MKTSGEMIRERMIPPRKHLEADDLAIAEVNLRLEEGHELAVLESVANSLLDLSLGDESTLHPSVEPDRTRDAPATGVVHSDVGAAYNVGDSRIARRSQSDSCEAPTWIASRT